MPCSGGGSPGPHPGGKLRGLAGGGLQAHTLGGEVSRPTPPTWTYTAAGGTHPTGMHSCDFFVFGHLNLIRAT